KWSGTSGSVFGSLGLSGNGPTAMAISGSDVYVGGSISAAGGLFVNHLARWNINTGTWSPLGTPPNDGANNAVYALATSGSDVYVGGYFTMTGGLSANH